MVVVGSYEFNLEDEYERVGIPIIAEYPLLLPLILVLIILIVVIAVYFARR